MISNIPIGGSISPEGFLLPILLLVVIIVAVVIVIVILIVIVDDVSLILKLSFTVISFLEQNHFYLSDPLISGLCWACAFHQDKASSVKEPVANVYSLLSLPCTLAMEKTLTQNFSGFSVPIGIVEVAMAAACAFRAEEMPSLISCRMASKVMTGFRC
ncbi:hypothetical protein Tco_1540568 [Tanacetum coccineum]